MQSPARIKAYMLSCVPRESVRIQTLSNLAATDWGEEPTVVIDRSPSESYVQREVDTGLRLLGQAIDEGAQFILFLEDDLEFNSSLRHNLNSWTPLRGVRPGEHFFGSLYNPGITPLYWGPDRHFYVTSAEGVYGSQAFIFSSETARFMALNWEDVQHPIDLRMAWLASRVSPIYFHFPSLVQHVGYQSAGNGWYHCASDFQCKWRAESRQDGRTAFPGATRLNAAVNRALQRSL